MNRLDVFAENLRVAEHVPADVALALGVPRKLLRRFAAASLLPSGRFPFVLGISGSGGRISAFSIRTGSGAASSSSGSSGWLGLWTLLLQLLLVQGLVHGQLGLRCERLAARWAAVGLHGTMRLQVPVDFDCKDIVEFESLVMLVP